MKNRLQTLLIIKDRKKRRYQASVKNKSSFKKLSLISVILFLMIIASIPLIGGYFYIQLTSDLPSAEWISAYLNPQNGILLEPTTLYDRDAQNEIYRLQHQGNSRKFLSLDPNQTEFISPYVVQLTVATKQPDFWSSSGYNKQFFSNVQDRTIAEELVVRLLLWDEPPGLRRDLRMRLLAAQIVEKYGRAQVLEWYLNSVNYGHYTIGISSAAQLYFNKNATDLNLAESALMVATSLTPALNPLDAPQAALENQENLLTTLNEKGFVTDQDYVNAKQTTIELVTEIQPLDSQANTFSNLVLNDLYDLYGRDRVELGGIRVTTTLDYSLQTALYCTLNSQIDKINGNFVGSDQCEPERLLPSLFETLPADLNLLGSGIILDPSTGDVVALVGNLDGEREYSVLDSKQGGSILTPLIAVNAFVRGFSPATQVWDIPGNLPAELSSFQLPMDSYKGPLRFRTAIANNYLAGVTKLYDQLGYDVVRRSANSFGLTTISNLSDIQGVLFSGDSTNV
ncbi:MAG TPA: transglycosylase domain-containing protein, partial [Anaerolineaceae bacterium]|nr:transglycosylase domain-containing protein [Anaerolineaceae bacterium]